MTDHVNQYREEMDAKRIIQIREITRGLPQACSDFIRSIAISTSTLTRLAYAIDLRTFFSFLHQERVAFSEKSILSASSGGKAGLYTRAETNASYTSATAIMRAQRGMASFLSPHG